MRPNRSRLGGLKYLKLTGKRAKLFVGLAAVVPALAIGAAATLTTPATASASTVLIGSGSSAAQPYMVALFAAYHKLHKSISFKYTPDGGNAGVKDVQSGISQFAVQTAAPLPSQTNVTFSKVFLDALCVDVNSKNKLNNLSLSQVAGAFKQPPTYTTWSQLGSSLGGDSILTEGRNSAAGQFTFFQGVVLNGAAENSSTTQLTSDGLVKVAIQKNKDAIGYVGLANSGVKGEAKATGEKALSINGIACSPANVKKKSYPLWRYDWSVVPRKAPNPAVLQFFKWVSTSAAAGKVLSASGAVPAFNKK
ncbi:MAG TPA: substrate-binding domain-containing protein [Solirubrobacteraceae bacterium]|nr:substrate-binding domain-containing protein [Solirubrobacteraceae bacterium]